MSDEFKVGAEIDVAHPFVRDEYHGFDEDGPFKRMTWRPGTRVEPIPPDDAEEVADAIGTQIITIVSIHKPGSVPARVFFTRRWRDPDGHEFGKTKCHIKTVQALRRRKYCMDVGLCVTVEPLNFIYTGGEEAGMRIGLINYPRFPSEPGDITARALDLARHLRVGLSQHSFRVVTPKDTIWESVREESGGVVGQQSKP